MVMPNYSLFSVIGLEIEYMLVDIQSLNVASKSDVIIQALAGELVNEFSLGEISVSNELVLHVLELKNHPPLPATPSLINKFQQAIHLLAPRLKAENLMLLPTAAHPWMNPIQETKRWPHGNHDIYQTYDRIFNCQGHGWANLQSMHVNLPFANDDDFSLLHNGIRLLLPLLPALAASSPILEGQFSGLLDARLSFYNKNQAKIPSISGEIIPEFVKTESAYQDQILTPMYQAIAPFDPDRHLQYEWLNSRGAIPKFDYQAIEIRLLDTQECVSADLSIALSIYHILKSWAQESEHYLKHPYDTATLKALYLQTLKTGLNTPIEDRNLLTQWQLPVSKIKTCRDVWHALIEKHAHQLDNHCQTSIEAILTHGNLSERILKKTGTNPTQDRLKNTYQTLAACLLENRMFIP
jgi:gamma-glutamyl:cysteine ligase YbdK (ATP-grasp superfamily)